MSFEISNHGDSGALKIQRKHLTGSAKWKDIEDLINRWAKKRRTQAYEHELYLRELRGVQKDKKHGFIDGPRGLGGAVGGGGTRMTVSLPQELLQYIEAFYPNFLSTKEELHEFKKRFPKFVVPEVS